MYCPGCGQPNEGNAQACQSCGAPMPQAQQAPPAPPAGYAPPAAYQPPAPPAAYPPPAQPYGYAPPSGQYQPAMAMPPNYLWQSIVVTLLCCWPLGIPAIVFATQVGKKYGMGDYAGAAAASKKARTWMTVALVLGVIWIALSIIGSVISSTQGL